MADPEKFIFKSKPVTYTEAFVKFYNKMNHRQVYKLYKIIELVKLRILITKKFCNLGVYQIIEILLVFRSAHIIPKNQDKFVFYVNNYID